MPSSRNVVRLEIPADVAAALDEAASAAGVSSQSLARAFLRAGLVAVRVVRKGAADPVTWQLAEGAMGESIAREWLHSWGVLAPGNRAWLWQDVSNPEAGTVASPSGRGE